jgi:subtilisin-like proprotein convertase family protein
VLHNRTGGSADDLVINGLDVAAVVGEAAAGNWQLKVADRAGLDVGSLVSWSVAIVGDCDGGGGGNWSGSATPNLATVDNGSACTSIDVSGSGNAADVLLSISGNHAWRSVLRGTLEHNGTLVNAFPTGTFPSQSGAFSFTDRAVAGLSGDAGGEWTLCIIDTDAFGDTGVLSSWSIHN